MATKTFGNQEEPKTVDELTAALHKLVGEDFPLSLSVVNGKIVAASYETEWKEGGTEAVATDETHAETGEPVYEYKESYTQKKLPAAQIKKIDDWIASRLAE